MSFTENGKRRSHPQFRQLPKQKSRPLLSIFAVGDDYRMNGRENGHPARKAVLLAPAQARRSL